MGLIPAKAASCVGGPRRFDTLKCVEEERALLPGLEGATVMDVSLEMTAALRRRARTTMAVTTRARKMTARRPAAHTGMPSWVRYDLRRLYRAAVTLTFPMDAALSREAEVLERKVADPSVRELACSTLSSGPVSGRPFAAAKRGDASTTCLPDDSAAAPDALTEACVAASMEVGRVGAVTAVPVASEIAAAAEPPSVVSTAFEDEEESTATRSVTACVPAPPACSRRPEPHCGEGYSPGVINATALVGRPTTDAAEERTLLRGTMHESASPSSTTPSGGWERDEYTLPGFTTRTARGPPVKEVPPAASRLRDTEST
jgi:hypothetical protein